MYVHFLTVKEVHRDVKALKNVNAIRDIGSLKYFKACETVDAPRDAAIFVLISFNYYRKGTWSISKLQQLEV